MVSERSTGLYLVLAGGEIEHIVAVGLARSAVGTMQSLIALA
ncbi:hypothetical protein [Cryobacterium frigoriphilum]|nr:hypothetical protein [Cryobacterium frigoriphilum]